MAYTASLNADTHLSGAGGSNLSFNQRENAWRSYFHRAIRISHPMLL
jgi:hypothetical protein